MRVEDFIPAILPPNWEIVSKVEDGACFRNFYKKMIVIVSCSKELDGKNWLHVSCSRSTRLPAWEELSEVKEIFIGANKTALQLLPAKDKHVNIHNYCLHLWHCLDGDVTPDFTRGFNTI